MGVYRVTIAGRAKPILLRAANRTKAIDRVVTEAKALTAEEVEDAFDKGESVWRDGEPFPVDPVAEVKDAGGDGAAAEDAEREQ